MDEEANAHESKEDVDLNVLHDLLARLRYYTKIKKEITKKLTELA